MGLFNFRSTSSPDTAGYQDVLALYQRLRPLRMKLNNKMVKRLSREALDAGAKKLGILRNGTFVFETEDESSVLMDYCIYNVLHNGRNTVEQYLCDCPPDPDSDEMTCLRAMQHATYTLLVVLRLEPGVGCHIRNLFTDETRLLVDIGLSQSAQEGMMMATRVLDFGEFVATGGAALPVVLLDDEGIEDCQRKFSARARDDHFDPAPVIRECLERGASSRVRYQEEGAQCRFDAREDSPPSGSSARRTAAIKKQYPGKPMGNRRCKCGSGKMMKNCCGKSQSPR